MCHGRTLKVDQSSRGFRPNYSIEGADAPLLWSRHIAGVVSNAIRNGLSMDVVEPESTIVDRSETGPLPNLGFGDPYSKGHRFDSSGLRDYGIPGTIRRKNRCEGVPRFHVLVPSTGALLSTVCQSPVERLTRVWMQIGGMLLLSTCQ